jgi:hypothetical protein
MTSDGKPVSQLFSDELTDLLSKYHKSGLENAQAVGVLVMITFNLLNDLYKDLKDETMPF